MLATKAGKQTPCVCVVQPEQWVSNQWPHYVGLNPFFPLAHQWKSTTRVEERSERKAEVGFSDCKRPLCPRLWPAARQWQQRRVRPGRAHHSSRYSSWESCDYWMACYTWLSCKSLKIQLLLLHEDFNPSLEDRSWTLTQEPSYKLEEREGGGYFTQHRGRENKAMTMWRTAGALLLILHTGKSWFSKTKYTVVKYTAAIPVWPGKSCYLRGWLKCTFLS